MEKNLVDIQNGGQDLFDEINEDKASCRSKEERNVQSKIRHRLRTVWKWKNTLRGW